MESLREKGVLRALPQLTRLAGSLISDDKRPLIDFGSNDYLNLSKSALLRDAVLDCVRTHGWGSGASPLICGRTDVHAELESELARLTSTEAAMLFPSGYMANVGAITSISGPHDTIFSDAKNHASIVDGCRLSKAQIVVYPHHDLSFLDDAIRRVNDGRILIVTDGLFSMDGDMARLPELASIATKHGAMLMVDEAHATGVFGKHGAGISEMQGVGNRVDLHVGTLSKALGAHGGFVAGSNRLIDWLRNRARSYIYSTALPAANCAAAIRALEIVRSEPLLGSQLIVKSNELRKRLSSRGWNIGQSQSQIIPILLRSKERAMRFSGLLRNQRLFVPGIRPPSVPEGESLLRISLTTGHTEEMIEDLLSALDQIRDSEV